jgi:formate hydrogenlyase subunit 3/multisubunit Na+/H+ antiporter MnhD subunit
MSVAGFIILGGVIFQIILAVAVVNDARSRGHDGLKWLVLTLLFGIAAVLIYLITRNDEKLPESDRPEDIGVRAVTLYSITIIGGLILGLVVAATLNTFVYPIPCTGDSQGTDTVEAGVNCAHDSVDERVEAQRDTREQRNEVALYSILGGGVGLPALLYSYRNEST